MGLRVSALFPTNKQAKCRDLSTSQVGELDAITHALSVLFDAPISLVTLFKDNRVLQIKNTLEECVLPGKMRLEDSICSKLLLPHRPEALVISDATRDRRVRTLPAITGGPKIRSYMGVPLVTEKTLRIGSLCIVDRRVRTWCAEDLSLVAALSQVVVDVLRDGPAAQPLALCDVDKEGWELLYTNRAWIDDWGHQTAFWSARRSPDLSITPWARYRSRISQRGKFTVKCLDRDEKHVTTILFTPASTRVTSITIPSLPAGRACGHNSLYFITPLTREDTLDLRGLPSHVPGLQDCSVGPMLGRGGFGCVYFGTWHGDQVAVKVVTPDPACLRPWSEAIIMDDLHHPNLVALHEWITTPAETFIVMELCRGGCLRQAIDRGDVADFQKQIMIARGIATGMEYLHHIGIVHADLNCNNILLDDGGTSKVADFGLSRMLTGRMTTKTHGTLTHAPVELLVTGALTRACDVYAFGVILWEIFDQRRAYAGMTRDQIMFAKLQRRDRFDVELDCPDVVRSLITACTDPEPQDRPPFTSILQSLCALPSPETRL